MLHRIASLALAVPRRVLAVAVLVLIGAGVFGIPVADSLSAGGFQDPTSESAQATAVLTEKFGQSDQQLLILVSAPGGVDNEPARSVGVEIVGKLRQSPFVFNATSPWTGPASGLVSTDGTSGVIVANLKGGENDAQKYARALADQLAHDRDGVRVRAGGGAMVYAQINHQNEHDLLLMESIAIPLSFAVLVWVFGGLLAAALPVALGGAGDRGVDGGTAVDHPGHRRLDLRAQPQHRDGPGAGDRLHAADHQPLPRRVGRRRRPRPGTDHDHDHRRPHRAVLGEHGRAVDGGAGAVPDVLPQIVRLRRGGDGDLRGDRGDRGDTGGDRRAGSPAARSHHAPGSARILVSLNEDRDASRGTDRPDADGRAGGRRGAVPRGEVGLPR